MNQLSHRILPFHSVTVATIASDDKSISNVGFLSLLLSDFKKILFLSSVILLFSGHLLPLKLPLYDGIRLCDLRELFNSRVYDWFVI